MGLIGAFIGLLFAASALVPLGFYHFEGEANISGMLWNLMLPTGWFDMAIGLALLFRERIGLRGKGLRYLTLLGGVISIGLFYLQDIDLFLSFWHGTRGDFDVDGKGFLTALPFYTGLISILTGLLMRISSYQKNGFSKERTL